LEALALAFGGAAGFAGALRATGFFAAAFFGELFFFVGRAMPRTLPRTSTGSQGAPPGRAAGRRDDAYSRGDAWPMWMWAPVASPATGPRNAMNEIPALRRKAISAVPSGLSGVTATSRAWR
jgi:hypothetical protein